MSDGDLVRITQPTLDVLEVLIAHRDEEIHGWALMQATDRGGPTVYKILERLASLGWVAARWEMDNPEPGKPRRRLYRLTGDGLERAHALLAVRRANRDTSTARPQSRPPRPAFEVN